MEKRIGQRKAPNIPSTPTEKDAGGSFFSAMRQIEELNAKAEASKFTISWREANRSAELKTSDTR